MDKPFFGWPVQASEHIIHGEERVRVAEIFDEEHTGIGETHDEYSR